MKQFWVYISFIVLMGLNSKAQEIQVKATANKNKINIGEPFTYTISVQHSGRSSIILPILPDTFKGFELLKKDSPVTTNKNGLTSIQQNYTLTHFDSGTWFIPAFSVIDNGTTALEIKTDSIGIAVSTPLVDLKKPIKDIVGPDKESFFSIKKVAAAILIILAMMMVAWLIYKKTKQKKENISYKSIIKQLKDLQQRKVWHNNPKLFCEQSSLLLKQYLHYHLKHDAIEKSTQELEESLLKNSLLESHTANLIAVMNRCDLVKFAKASLVENEYEAIVNNILLFINKTQNEIKQKQNG